MASPHLDVGVPVASQGWRGVVEMSLKCKAFGLFVLGVIQAGCHREVVTQTWVVKLRPIVSPDGTGADATSFLWGGWDSTHFTVSDGSGRSRTWQVAASRPVRGVLTFRVSMNWPRDNYPNKARAELKRDGNIIYIGERSVPAEWAALESELILDLKLMAP